MELFTKLFQAWLVFVYHCFDRVVLSGYLMGLQRPGQVVYWLQHVLGIEAITKEVLSARTAAYVRWVESFARNRNLPIPWHDEGVRMEDYVRPYLRRMERENRFGVYFIFQAMERGWTFRPGRLAQRRPDGDADYPILRRYRSRYRYYSLENPPLRARRRAGLWLGVKLNFISEMLKPFHEVAFQAL